MNSLPHLPTRPSASASTNTRSASLPPVARFSPIASRSGSFVAGASSASANSLAGPLPATTPHPPREVAEKAHARPNVAARGVVAADPSQLADVELRRTLTVMRTALAKLSPGSPPFATLAGGVQRFEHEARRRRRLADSAIVIVVNRAAA